MEVSYRREAKHNYLVAGQVEEMDGYEARMLAGNEIRGLLRMHIRYQEGHPLYFYEITSRQPLSRLLENRSITRDEICQLMIQLQAALTDMEEYLLEGGGILMEPQYIYVEPELFQTGLCLVPGLQGDFQEKLSQLLQYILKQVNHKDRECVVLAYSLYQESLKENCGMEDLLSLIAVERHKGMTEKGTEPWQKRFSECEEVDQNEYQEKDQEVYEEYQEEQSIGSWAEHRADRREERTGRRGEERTGRRAEERTGCRGEERTGRRAEERTGRRSEDRAGHRTKERTRRRAKERTGRRMEEWGGQRTEERTGRRGEERTEQRTEERTGHRSEQKTNQKPQYKTGPKAGKMGSHKAGYELQDADNVAAMADTGHNNNSSGQRSLTLVPQAILWLCVAVLLPTVLWLFRGKGAVLRLQNMFIIVDGGLLLIFAVMDLWKFRRRISENIPQNEESPWMILYEDDEEEDHPSEPEKNTNEFQEHSYNGVEENFQTTLLSDRSSEEELHRLKALNDSGEDIVISYYPFVIGKHKELADYVLLRDTVSRFHVRIDRKDEHFTITDLNSTNGTRVKGRLLEANETMELELGDEVYIADAGYVFY